MAINLAATTPDKTLFNEEAEKLANIFSQAKGQNKPSQIRRFYDELVGWEERVGGSDEKFKELEAFIKMLNAKVAYAKGRKLVDEEFARWFRECVNQTNTALALKHFRLHFEAMLGFIKPLVKD